MAFSGLNGLMTARGRRAWRAHAIRRPDGPNNGRRRGAAQAACAIRGVRSLLGTAGKGAYGVGIVKGRDLAFVGRACLARLFHKASRSLTSGLAVLGLCASLVGQEAAGQWPRQVETPQGQCMVFQPQRHVGVERIQSARAALADPLVQEFLAAARARLDLMPRDRARSP